MKNLRIRTIIIDDEQEARDVMQALVRKIPEIQLIDTCNGAEAGLDSILRNKPDLVFTDIKMPRKSGLEMVRELSEKQAMTTVVFVTAFDEYAIQAIRLAAFDFLLKPVDPDELHQVIRRFQAEKLQEEFDRKIALLVSQFRKPDKIRLNTRAGFILVDPADIVYIQADGNYSEIHFSRNKKELVSLQLGTLAELLPPGKFFRISRSALINLDFLRKVDRRSRKCELERNGEVFTLQVSRELIGEFDRILK
jgi:two-component system LytT family response regulator